MSPNIKDAVRMIIPVENALIARKSVRVSGAVLAVRAAVDVWNNVLKEPDCAAVPAYFDFERRRVVVVAGRRMDLEAKLKRDITVMSVAVVN